MAPPKRQKHSYAKEKFSNLPATDPDDESSISDASDMVDDDYGDRSFLLRADVGGEKNPQSSQRKRRKTQVDDDDDEQPRQLLGKKDEDPDQKLHFLLPLKTNDGVQMRFRQVEDVPIHGPEKKNVKQKNEVIDKKPTPSRPEHKPFVNDPKWMSRIASLAFDVLEDPEKNLKCVRELLGGLTEAAIPSAMSVAIMASMTEIFKDILPGYRIHVASEIEQDQQMKKETLKLRQHEEHLLAVYQKFLQHLEKTTKVLYTKKYLTPEDLNNAGSAVKCLSELLVAKTEFNFRKNVIDSLVFISTCRYPALVEIAVNTIQRVFKQDRQGDSTVDVMSSVSKIAKTKGHRLSVLLLDTFMDIKVSKDLLKSLAEEKDKAAKLDRKLLSYKERKHKKELAKVEKELQHNQLEENKKLKGRLHSQIIQSVFAIYFRVLRHEDDKIRLRLLPSVLKGVARFVHFIGVEYMDDLVKTLNGIVKNPECRPLEKLLCVRTVFSILSGDGAALNIDPHEFYEFLFQVLRDMNGTEERALYVELFHCIQKGFIERRKLISCDRAARCVKMIAGLAMRSVVKDSVALTLLLKAVFMAHPSLDRYLDEEYVASTVLLGAADKDGTTPSGPLWEIHQLRNHHHPANRAIVDALLGHPKVLTTVFSRLLHCDPVEYLVEDDSFDC